MKQPFDLACAAFSGMQMNIKSKYPLSLIILNDLFQHIIKMTKSLLIYVKFPSDASQWPNVPYRE